MNKKITISLSIIFALIVLIFIFWRGSLEIKINKEADIKIGFKNYKNISVIKKNFFAKKYKVIISRKGYLDYEKEISVKPWKNQTLEVDLMFNPVISLISKEKVSYPFYFEDNLYSLSSDRKSLLIMNNKGEIKNKINTGLSYIFSFILSPDGKMAILFVNDYEKPENRGMSYFEDGAETTWLLGLENRELRKLPNNMKTTRWFNENNFIYNYFDTQKKESYLIKYDVQNNTTDMFFNLPEHLKEAFFVISPDGKKIALYNDPVELNPIIYILTLNSNRLEPISENNPNYGAIWSNDSKSILYTTGSYPDTGPSLNVLNLNDNKKLNTELQTTSAPIYKALFSSENNFIYAFAPDEVPRNYLSNQNQETDNFWRINIKTGERLKVKSLDLNVIKPYISNDGKYIYFLSQNNIYKMQIEE